MLFTPIKIYFYLDPLLLLKVLAELILDERLDFDVPGLPPLSSANLTVDEAPDLGLAPVPGRLLDSIFRFFLWLLQNTMIGPLLLTMSPRPLLLLAK